MKTMLLLASAGLGLLLTGCASTPLALAPVGPSPNTIQNSSTQGSLEVYSRFAQRSDDQSQGSRDDVWYQHTGYYVYDLQGQMVKHVHNASGHYDLGPRVVNLPAGQYIVKARSADYLWVKVPVIIKSGEITTVHLDDQWSPPNYARGDVVRMPNGTPVGWGE